ncbi:hypothetical protein [Longimicrobium sp.]|uniref:hypothetical protein n=1 Tax=Longimicrobium sp. TaxID=2029185 RepID=UPI002BEC7D5E|nr:hypothetical protein [Longimicrobium sp.]HSU15320.1 hypothetical protein [Longimicrobium sp.]
MRSMARWAISAAVAGALAFGAAGAAASPEPAAAGGRQCNNGDCKALCKLDGARSGTCGGDQCICIY